MISLKSGWVGRAALAAGVATLAWAWSAPAAPADAPAPLPAKARSKLPEPSAQTRPASQPIPVYIGMQVLRLTNLDITNNLFGLDFWMWFRWADDSVKPYESFELVNGKVDFRHVERVEKVAGMNYACVRVQATMTCFWEVARFPLCRQRLTVEVEDDDLEADQLAFLPDTANCGVDDGFHAAGWQFSGFSADRTDHAYSTNYGDPRYAAGRQTLYSRAIFGLQLQRADVLHSFKIFSGLYLSALVAFTVFFVKPDHRLALTVGAIFAVVASHSVISAYLPDAGTLTLADKLHLATAAVILISLFETAYSLHLFHRNRLGASKRLDRLTFCVAAPLYLAANVWLLAG
jgi:hypothetical protein